MRWIEAFEQATPASRRTKVWDICTKGKDGVSGLCLGKVSWHAPWRKYAFFPNSHTLYEPQCLRDIAEFCDTNTSLRRMEKFT